MYLKNLEKGCSVDPSVDLLSRILPNPCFAETAMATMQHGASFHSQPSVGITPNPGQMVVLSNGPQVAIRITESERRFLRCVPLPPLLSLRPPYAYSFANMRLKISYPPHKSQTYLFFSLYSPLPCHNPSNPHPPPHTRPTATWRLPSLPLDLPWDPPVDPVLDSCSKMWLWALIAMVMATVWLFMVVVGEPVILSQYAGSNRDGVVSWAAVAWTIVVAVIAYGLVITCHVFLWRESIRVTHEMMRRTLLNLNNLNIIAIFAYVILFFYQVIVAVSWMNGYRVCINKRCDLIRTLSDLHFVAMIPLAVAAAILIYLAVVLGKTYKQMTIRQNEEFLRNHPEVAGSIPVGGVVQVVSMVRPAVGQPLPAGTIAVGTVAPDPSGPTITGGSYSIPEHGADQYGYGGTTGGGINNATVGDQWYGGAGAAGYGQGGYGGAGAGVAAVAAEGYPSYPPPPVRQQTGTAEGPLRQWTGGSQGRSPGSPLPVSRQNTGGSVRLPPVVPPPSTTGGSVGRVVPGGGYAVTGETAYPAYPAYPTQVTGSNPNVTGGNTGMSNDQGYTRYQ